jgi:hypothetical protein
VPERHDLAEIRGRGEIRLTDHDYEILRRFEQRSSLRTYLAVVIYRLSSITASGINAEFLERQSSHDQRRFLST